MKSITFVQFRKRFSFAAEDAVFRMDSTAMVYKAFDHDLKRDVAVKVIADEAKVRRYPSLKAMSKLFRLEHGHLVHYFDFIRIEPSTEHAGFDVLVMDFIGGGNLSHAIGKGDNESKGRIVEGILGGLGALHQNGMFHGNLKIGNVLLQDIGHMHVRMSDYGYIVTQQYEVTGNQYRLETIQYLAPEQIEPENFGVRGTVRENVDFWTLGMLVYELFTGKYVFGDGTGTSSDLMTRILHADLPADLERLPGNYGELVKACLIRNAKDRPRRIADLRRILDGGHVWDRGKLRRKPQKASPGLPKIPTKIKCGHCKQMTRGKTGVCNSCGKPLRGPVFLMQFKRPGITGFWAMLFMTAVFVPLCFLYYDHYYMGVTVSDRLGSLEADLPQNSVNEPWMAVFDALFGPKLFLIGFGAILSTVFFLVWFSRVSRNLTALGIRKRSYPSVVMVFSIIANIVGMALILSVFVEGDSSGTNYTPFLAFIGVILTIVGLALPLFVFQEIWRGSNPNYLDQTEKWKKSPGSAMIFIWWLISILLPLVVFLPFFQGSLYKEGAQLWFVLTTGLVGAYWVIAMLLVIRINRRQVSKFWGWVRQGDLH